MIILRDYQINPSIFGLFQSPVAFSALSFLWSPNFTIVLDLWLHQLSFKVIGANYPNTKKKEGTIYWKEANFCNWGSGMKFPQLIIWQDGYETILLTKLKMQFQ